MGRGDGLGLVRRGRWDMGVGVGATPAHRQHLCLARDPAVSLKGPGPCLLSLVACPCVTPARGSGRTAPVHALAGTSALAEPRLLVASCVAPLRVGPFSPDLQADATTCPGSHKPLWVPDVLCWMARTHGGPPQASYAPTPHGINILPGQSRAPPHSLVRPAT